MGASQLIVRQVRPKLSSLPKAPRVKQVSQKIWDTLFERGASDLRGVRSKMGVSFWLSLESYTGFRNQPLWSPPNLDHTL